MALCRLPVIPLNPPASSSPRLFWSVQRSPSIRNLLLVCAGKTVRTGRKSRASKSNAELCDELRAFVLVAGFPENHVPSTKQLLDHGRKDLANIVRRRGHKGVAKLLENPPDGDINSDLDSSASKDSSEESPCIVAEDQKAQDLQNHDAEVSSVEVVASEITKGTDSEVSFPDPSEHSFIRSSILHSKDVVSTEIPVVDSNRNSSSELVASEGLDELKVDHLKELLREKELELSLLKQQLEEEKLALSSMQGKFQSELNQVQDTISCKEEELRGAEENLAGLKEVLLEYRGYAENVEVTGSFNGWQHKLSLDRQTPSNTMDISGLREATLWSTILWLYPGVYEIKFIADGHWVIDPQREFISRDNIVNNILRVGGDGDPSIRQVV